MLWNIIVALLPLLSVAAPPKVGSSSGFALSFTGRDPSGEIVSVAGTKDFAKGEDFWPTQNITASFWFRSDGQMNGVFNIRNKDDNNYFQPISTAGNTYFQGATTSVLYENLTKWRHHAFTWNGTHGIWYLDGTQTIKKEINVPHFDFSAEKEVYFTLGKHSLSRPNENLQFGPTSGTLGQVDDITLWNRVLSPQEIHDLYDQTTHLTGNEQGLVLFYDFDDEADLSLIARNKGQAGSEYDMHFGVILGSKNTFALTTAESVQLPLKPPYWAPSTRPSDLPRGKPLVVTIVPPETLEITLPAYDPDGDALTVTITTLPANATITDLDDHTLNAGDTVPSIDGIFKVKYTVKQDIEENFQHDTFEYEAEDGSGNSASAKVFVLLNTVPQALDSSLFTVEDRSQLIRLPGTDTDGDQIRTWITHAPTRGSLYDAVSTGGDSVKIGNKIDLSTLPALVKNIGGGVYYVPPQDESGLRNFDRFAFATKDPRGQMSSDAWVEVSVKPINKLPIAYERAADTIENKAVLIDVFGVDIEGWTLAYSIEELPKKGKLYRIPDDFDMSVEVTSERIENELIPMLSEEDEITQPFSPFALSYFPVMSYAEKVLNVSSFWGGSLSYHPIQALGPQDVFEYGDHPLTWCPLTRTGTGISKGGDDILQFHHDHDKSFDLYGYTEFIELEFKQQVYVREIEIGYPRGMGSIVGIRGWHPENKWSPLWEGDADPKIQEEHHLTRQYHTFRPTLCQTPYKTNRIRIEKDTRTVADWNEMDYVQLIGADVLPEGILEYGKRKLLYVPNTHAFGDDVIKYAVNDCPFDRFRSSQEANVSIWIEPVDDPPIAVEFTVLHEAGETHLETTVELQFIDVDGDVNKFELLSLPEYVAAKDPLTKARITSVPYQLSVPRLIIRTEAGFVCESSTDTALFRVTDEGGQYSEAKFTIDFDCDVIFRTSKGLRTAIYVLFGLVITYILVTAIIVQLYSSTVIIKSASVLFCNLILIFNITMAVGSLFYTMSPEKGSYVCNLRPWFTGVPIVGVMSNLLVKTNRIRKIFNNKSMKKLKITNKDILKQVVIMLSFEFVILIWFSASGISEARLLSGEGTTAGNVVWLCDSTNETHYAIWLVVQILYIAFYMYSGAAMSFQTRNVPSAFNESSHVGVALFVMLFFGIIIVPLQFLVDDNPDATMLLRAGGQLFCALSINICLFGPKLYYIFKGMANDKSMTTGNNTATRTSTVTGATNQQLGILRKHIRDAKLEIEELRKHVPEGVVPRRFFIEEEKEVNGSEKEDTVQENENKA